MHCACECRHEQKSGFLKTILVLVTLNVYFTSRGQRRSNDFVVKEPLTSILTVKRRKAITILLLIGDWNDFQRFNPYFVFRYQVSLKLRNQNENFFLLYKQILMHFFIVILHSDFQIFAFILHYISNAIYF